MKWTIAILSVRSRYGLMKQLVRSLVDQIGDRDVEIFIADQEDWSVSEKRQYCLDNARGEYFCFVDDDDKVADNYIDAIYPLLDGVDYIGFRLQYYHDGDPWKPTYHSLQYSTSDRFADENGFYRGVSHLNPIRTEIARQGRYEGGFGEDDRWAVQVRPETEHYVDQVMYHYFFSPSNSLTAGRP